MRKIFVLAAFLAFVLSNTAMAANKDKQAQEFINKVVQKIEPVLKDYSIAYWKATTTGFKTWYKKYEEKEIEYRRIMANKDWFAEVKSLHKSKIGDPIVKRQIDILYLDFLENQIDSKLSEELVRRSAALTRKFTTYRARVKGVEVTDNKIRQIMRESLKPAERKATWEASKQIGKAVADDLIALVKKRNEAARSLGFKNYYQMQLVFLEQNERELFGLLDSLARQTDKPFKKLKVEIDTVLAKRHGIKTADLRPWHYEDVFFQETPQIYNVDIEKFFAGRNPLKIVKDYYKGIGMPVDDILARSDLFERKGKEQHAYCTHIDRWGDIRILANIQNDEYWTETMLHELGHSVYEKYFAKDLPYLLREASHIFTTEGVAELFGRLTKDPTWLASYVAPELKKEIASISGTLEKTNVAQRLIFARWVEVMTHFERELYSNSDQDFNKLWWDLVEKYQMVRRPEGRNNPDWAAKIHFATAPVYYHNYLLGELFASQLINYFEKNIAPANVVFINNPKLGEYLKTKVFAPGDKMRWDKFIKFATGEKFTAKYFARENIK